MKMHIVAVVFLLGAGFPALAAEWPTSTASVPEQDAVNQRASTLSAERVAALQKTIEKRKAKKARDRQAFRIASAEAQRMVPGPPQPLALRSVGVQGAPSNAILMGPVGLDPRNSPGLMFAQAIGQAGPAYGQATGGPGQCARQ